MTMEINRLNSVSTTPMNHPPAAPPKVTIPFDILFVVPDLQSDI